MAVWSPSLVRFSPPFVPVFLLVYTLAVLLGIRLLGDDEWKNLPYYSIRAANDTKLATLDYEMEVLQSWIWFEYDRNIHKRHRVRERVRWHI